MMEKNNAGLIVDKVSRHFKGVKAVDEVSFHLKPGEALALVGPNGAGKSTLIQLISRVDSISGGSIILDGTRIDKLSPERVTRLGIGRSFQTSRVFPALSVVDSINLGAQAEMLNSRLPGKMVTSFYELLASIAYFPSWKLRIAKRSKFVMEIIKLFGDRLTSKSNQMAYSLSYANRRRLEIARVLAGKPRYLLLDEPTAGMNPTETAELAELLLHLRSLQPDLAILVVEHKLSFVRKVADKVIVLNYGRILAEGEPNSVLNSPEVVDAYLGSTRKTSSQSGAHLG